MEVQEEIKTGYKQTVLGLIPEEWDIHQLKDVVDKSVKWSFTGGPFGSNLKAEDYTHEGVRIIQLQNIGDGVFYDNYKIYTSAKKANELLSCNIYPGEIIISKMGDPVARACFIPHVSKRYLMASDGIRIVPNEKEYDKYFVLSYINSRAFRSSAVKSSTGSTRQRIGLEDLRKIKLLKPPLSEQKAIADCLSTWDNAIENLSALIGKKELQKKALMQQLLTGKKRLKGFSGEWRDERLGEVFERVTRKNSHRNNNVVTISAQRGFVKQNDFFKKLVASDILDNYFLVRKGEFCYNKSYSNGYPWGATKRLKDFDEAVVTTLYICFGLKSEIHNSGDFFEQFFNANLLDKGLTQIAHEGGRAHGLLNVTPSDFFGLKIKVPSTKEQTAIAAVLQQADNEITLLQAKLAKFKQQKKGLMQVLLTGKKRLKFN